MYTLNHAISGTVLEDPWVGVMVCRLQGDITVGVKAEFGLMWEMGFVTWLVGPWLKVQV